MIKLPLSTMQNKQIDLFPYRERQVLKSRREPQGVPPACQQFYKMSETLGWNRVE